MEPDRARLEGLAADLLDWGGQHRRDLPWRDTRDPWAVLVSEVMLQQTQVGRVVGHWHDFLADFPTPEACAAAARAAVIRHWDGLGFNRRAVHLHEAAERVCEEHGGRVPDDLEALLALPGVGDYTARAVLAFAFERDVGVVDTNTARVLARAAAGRSLTDGQAQGLADRLVPAGRGWAHNQTMLDLAAGVCTKRDPDCGTCPVTGRCAWARAGWPAPDPATDTAGVSGTQSRFEGSDRQGRGRLVRALRDGPLERHEVPAAAGWPDQPGRARAVAEGLVADGLVVDDDGTLRLPG